MDFQGAGNNCGLLYSCSRMCTIEPYIYFFTINFNSSKTTARHCIPLSSSNIAYIFYCATTNIHLCSASDKHLNKMNKTILFG